MSNIIISRAALHEFARDLLVTMGNPDKSAEKIAASLIKSDMSGYTTHGVAQLPMYTSMITDGAIQPLANITITQKTDCIISVDGDDGFGQLVGEKATSAGIEAAHKSGMATIAIRNASHLGRLGEWAEQATDAGLVFTAFSNTGGGALNVAAFGGTERKLSTNPVAFAIPCFDALPFNIVVDFATSQVSGALIEEYARSGKPMPSEWTTTTSGEALVDANDIMNGEGALLPLGGRTTGHKGFGLALIAELLGGIAGGQVVGQSHPQWFSNAAIFSFLDPLHFLTVEDLRERVNCIASHLSEDNVRLPGQGAYQCLLLSHKQGVSLPDHVLKSLFKLADKLATLIPDEIILLKNSNSD